MSSSSGPGLAGRLLRGVVAGAVGTLAMDLIWWRRYRRGGGDDGFVDWDLATSTAGFDEAMTLSTVDADWVDAIRPWTSEPPLQTATPVLRTADCLRQSLAASLLAARRHNEKLSNPVCELFEIAKVYLPQDGQLPNEKRLLALCSGGDFLHVKGAVETLVENLAPAATVEFGYGSNAGCGTIVSASCARARAMWPTAAIRMPSSRPLVSSTQSGSTPKYAAHSCTSAGYDG